MSSGTRLRLALDAVALLDTRTGVGRFVDETLTRLATRPDLEITAFGYWPRARRRMCDVVPAGVHVSWLPMFGPPLRALWRRGAVPPIECWTGRTDVVHGPNFLVPPAWRAAEVVTVHDLTILRYPQFCTDDTLQFPMLIRRAIARGAWVHTVSQFVAGEVVDMLGAPPERVVVVPNGVTPVAEADPAAGRALAGSDRYVLALGTVEPRKDLPRLVAAFDRVAADRDDLRLVIAGPDGWGTHDLRLAIERAAHRSRIVRLGWVTEQQRAELLRGAATLAYPSIYEGFGLPPLEAMSAGTPVVTTGTGGITEVVGDAALVVPARDVDALAEALARVVDDESLAGSLRVRGSERVERYSWERTATGLADLYHRVVLDRA